MTSKERLERIKDDIEIGYLSTKHDNQKDKNNYLVMLESIEQDLDRLEKLEKENQELKERYKHRAETSNDLCKAVKQYEKVIEIFRKMCSLNNNKTLETEECFLRLTEEEYSLLKEVL